ncbi:bifunctional lysylphosphatidylglycerol flippase/synthetase MprF [Bifidobacterium samirii]|uniref:Lysyl-tRNA synthetase n=1 Tax=Bifidobacterium samirii TaxID=2306974 RepID=A0A430FVY4_9BIFI|nr:lysyl-tRNA synthetase [Bifidobacterium samirii]
MTDSVKQSVKPAADVYPGHTGGPRSQAWADLLADARRWNDAHPLAVGATGVFAALTVVAWLAAIGRGMPFPLTGLATTLGAPDAPSMAASLLLARGPVQLLVDEVLLLLMLTLAEPRLGIRRTVAAAILSVVLGVGVGLAACGGVAVLLHGTQAVARIRFALSPLMWGVGPLMAASAFHRPLWRRRIRLVGYAAVASVLLFGGSPGAYCLLAGALAGQCFGVLLAAADGRGRAKTADDPLHWRLGTSFEARRVFAAVALVLALGPLLASVSPTHAGPLSPLALLLGPGAPDEGVLARCLAEPSHAGCFFQFDLVRSSMPGAVLRSLLPTAVMAIMAWGLYRGRRLAAWVTVVCQAAASALAVVYYLVVPAGFVPDGFAALVRHGALASCVVNALPPAVFAVALLMSLRHFPMRTDRARLMRGLIGLGAVWLACAAGYLAFGLLRASDFHPAASWRDLVAELPGRFVPIGFLSHTRLRFVPVTPLASAVYQGVGLVFWAAVLVVCVRWMRDVTAGDDRDRAEAGRLVEHGGESMSFMATWEGNRYWRSPSGRSAVAYRVINGVALTCTGPFGDPGEWMTDLREFSRFCAAHSWTPVFYAVHRAQRDALVADGWNALEVGGEMVVDPRAWKTTGRKWQDIRTAINKARREGIEDVLVTFDKADADVRDQIEEISEQWAGDKALPEMKFTLGGVEELRDPRVRILIAQDASGRVLGVTSWLPTWRDGRIVGWTLDFMRHRTDAPNGIMEFLIARMAERLRDEGLEHPDVAAEFMSLSAAPLAGMNPQRDNTAPDGTMDAGTAMLQHAMQLMADWMEPAYGFRSLFNFKRKFQPSEEPVYVCYPDAAALPQLGLAVTRAYVPSLTAGQALALLRTLQR